MDFSEIYKSLNMKPSAHNVILLLGAGDIGVACDLLVEQLSVQKLLNTDLLESSDPRNAKKNFPLPKKLIRVALYLAATVFLFSVIYLRLEPLIVDHFAQSKAQETL